MLNYDFLVNIQIFKSFSDHWAIVPDQMSWLSWSQEKMTMGLAPKLRRLAGRHLMSRELPPRRCDICSWLSHCEERVRKLLLLLQWWSRDQLTASSFLARTAPAKIIALHANSHLILGSKSQLQLFVFNHQLFALHTRVWKLVNLHDPRSRITNISTCIYFINQTASNTLSLTEK